MPPYIHCASIQQTHSRTINTWFAFKLSYDPTTARCVFHGPLCITTSKCQFIFNTAKLTTGCEDRTHSHQQNPLQNYAEPTQVISHGPFQSFYSHYNSSSTVRTILQGVLVKSKDSCGVTAGIREPHKHNEIKLECIIHTKLREHKAITYLKLQIWECINIYNTHAVYIYCVHKLNCFFSATYIHTQLISTTEGIARSSTAC